MTDQQPVTVSAPRESWSSRLGFIFAAAGSAVGVGNVWRFPAVANEHGGAFLVVYLVMVATIGVSILLAELTIGRAARRNPVGAFRVLGGGGWIVAGLVGLLAAFLILSFYTVVAGWTLVYAVQMATGLLTGPQTDPAMVFHSFVAHPIQPVVSSAVFMTVTVVIVLGGVRGGIERANLILMPVLFFLLSGLVVRTLTLPGSGGAIETFLRLEPSDFTADALLAGLGQAFFSLSIGLGAMMTYGSYLAGGNTIVREASAVAGLDTLAALMSGLAILPAVLIFSVQPETGASLAFVTLPKVFAEMPLGAYFGTLFFSLLVIAALTSALSLIEPIVAYFIEEYGFRRSQIAVATGLYAFLLGVPSSLSMGAWSGYTIYGRPFLEIIDSLTADVLLPVGGLCIAVFVGWFMRRQVVDEAFSQVPFGRRLGAVWLFILRVPAPAAILWILIAGLSG